jgi:hypothetical protein
MLSISIGSELYTYPLEAIFKFVAISPPPKVYIDNIWKRFGVQREEKELYSLFAPKGHSTDTEDWRWSWKFIDPALLCFYDQNSLSSGESPMVSSDSSPFVRTPLELQESARDHADKAGSPAVPHAIDRVDSMMYV